MANPILVTGAAGRVGGIGRTVAELLLKRGKAVRAMVRNEDQRAQALRDMGAQVVVGDLLDLDSMHRCDCRLRDDVLRHVGFGYLPGCDGQCGGGGEASRRQSVHQYVADDAVTDACAADSASRRLLPDFHRGFGEAIESDQITIRRGQDFAGRRWETLRV